MNININNNRTIQSKNILFFLSLLFFFKYLFKFKYFFFYNSSIVGKNKVKKSLLYGAIFNQFKTIYKYEKEGTIPAEKLKNINGFYKKINKTISI